MQIEKLKRLIPENIDENENIEERISKLVKLLHATSRSLEDLTNGQIDGVVGRDGRTYLLPDAQEHLRLTESIKQAAILNGLPAHIALLNRFGTIISVNEAWRRFGRSNEFQGTEYGVGLNYLEICDGDVEAQHIAQGISLVLSGESKGFSLEYPCHSPTEDKWFLLMVTPLADDRHNGAIIMHLDITQQTRAALDRKILEDALFSEQERAHVTLNSLGDAVICTDTLGHITFLNHAAENLTGWSLENALGQSMNKIFRLLDSARQPITALPAERGGGKNQNLSQPQNYTLIARDGEEIAIDYSVATINGRDGNKMGAAYVFRDVSIARKLEEEIVHSARHDFLTGLPNRTLLNDRIGHAIALARRSKKKVVLLFLDLDGFKHINDSLGHPVGDLLLQSVAKRLSKCIREGDTVSRQGGDEFIVLLSELTDLKDAAHKAEAMLKAVLETHSTDHHDLHVTGSIGISVYPDDGLDAETLIKNADTAMYQAKANGRQSYQFFTPEMNFKAVERQSIEESMRRALRNQEFVLYYQPKVHLRTRRIIGAEALIRWTHPTLGPIAPSEFIPIAEDCGLIVPIGAWVLREACKQAQAWVNAGLPALTMAVNVSAMEFANDKFAEGVLAVLDETGLDPKRLELELTESVLMKRPQSTVAILQTLRNSGISVAIDDFGTGFSSLSYLRKFPVDALKIDRSFVHQICEDGEDSVIVKAVIGMARSLKLRVIAEGVEKLEELHFLRSQQCDEVQGYYFSRPVPAAQFEALFQAGTLGTTHATAERNQRANSRHKVLKDGKIISYDMQCVIDVKIRDMSASGALIQLESTAKLPDKFNLLLVSDRMLYPAAVRWRRSDRIGIQFIGEPAPSALRTAMN